MAPDRPRRPTGAGRGLKPGDQALWDKVTRGTTPLAAAPNETATTDTGSAPGPIAPEPKAKPAAKPSQARAPKMPRSLRPAGSGKSPAISLDLSDREVAQVGRPEPGLDRRNSERLRRGDRIPDGRIDLHGMTASRAHQALDRRIGEALSRGERLVLVITGKGGRNRHQDDAPFMRENTGILRQQAPRWLRGGPYASRIVGIYQAHPRHGGPGAFYVYLKKQR